MRSLLQQPKIEIISGGRDATVRFWNTQTGQPLCTPLKHNSAVVFVSFSPDYTKIVAGTWNRECHVWDAETRAQILAPSTSYPKGSLAVPFQPVSRYMAVSPDVGSAEWQVRAPLPDYNFRNIGS